MLTLTIFLSGFLSTLATCSTDVKCDVDFNRCYKFISNPEDFFSAEEKCKSFEGHLVSLRNAFEMKQVNEVAESMFAGYSEYWIGAMMGSSISWVWIDQTNWSYENWLSGQPDGKPVAMGTLDGGFWSSVETDQYKPYICGLPFSSTNSTTQTTLSPTTCPTPAVCPTCKPQKPYCEDGWSHFSASKSCYKLIYNLTSLEGENRCQSMGSHLASIHSQEENNFVSDFSRGAGAILIGLYKVSGSWYWYDNSPVDYVNWHQGEPSNSGGDENCVMVYVQGSLFSLWNDIPCNGVSNTPCKKPEMT